ncbi:MAG: hypothetical protein Q8N09_11555 [Thermodesulfovibrionia bacterium]|nr:hypothetical protein [Thermodesulfovibrionia bacterium]
MSINDFLPALIVPLIVLALLSIYGIFKKQHKFWKKGLIIFLFFLIMSFLSAGAGGIFMGIVIGGYGLMVLKKNDYETARVIFWWILLSSIVSIALLSRSF